MTAADRLRAELARAERALSDIELSDDHAHTSGAWDRANALRNRIARELAVATAARTPADLLAECAAAAGLATACNPDMETTP